MLTEAIVTNDTIYPNFKESVKFPAIKFPGIKSIVAGSKNKTKLATPAKTGLGPVVFPKSK